MLRANGWRAKIGKLLAIFVIAIAPLFSANTISVLAASNSGRATVPSGGDFYDDIPEAESAPLGAAQYFHIFSNETTINAHVNGNIATGDFTGNTNFGTNIIQGLVDQEINYLQNINKIANSSFVDSRGSDSRINKVVVGDDVDVALQNQQTVLLANAKMDHLGNDEIYQDPSQTETYINIKKELAQDKTQGDKWSQKETSKNVTTNFDDPNNREIKITPDEAEAGATYSVELTKVDEHGNPLPGAVFDLYKTGSDEPYKTGLTTNQDGKIIWDNLDEIGDYYFVETKAPDGYQLDQTKHYFTATIANQNSQSDYVYYNLDAAVLEKDTPLTISGISADGPAIIINVDLAGRDRLDIQSQIKLVIDDDGRHNQETEDFADAKVLFNFYNSQGTTIEVSRPFSGTMLAPEAEINAHQNVDGSMIANDVNVVGGETHRWDFQSAFQTGDGVPAELQVVNSKDETTVTTSVKGTKKWNDAGDNSQRPDKIFVDLYQNGVQIDYREITADDGWQYHFNNLPKYDEDGNEYLYTVKEWQVPGYVTDIDGDDITNTLATSISGQKHWVDNNNAAGKRPTSLRIYLYQKGIHDDEPIQIDEQEVTGEGNNWFYEFTNLPMYDQDGNKYTYTVKEEAVPGYTQTQDGNNFTNTIEQTVPATTSVTGTKTWDDNNNEAGLRPDKLAVYLYQNGEFFDKKEITVDDGWQYVFTDLPKYDQNGTEYEYTIGEETVPGYTSDREGTDLTNTIEKVTEPDDQTTEITGEKIWQDNNDAAGARPESVTIELLKNGESFNPVKQQKITAGEDGKWTYAFTDLPKNDEGGKEINYSVREVDVPGYTSEQVGNDFINTYFADETTTVSGSKTWLDNNDANGVRPDSITVELLQNGESMDPIKMQEVTAKANWQYSFTDLPKYDQEGKPYTYSVKEATVPGYTSNSDGLDLTNELVTTSIKGTKTWDDDNNNLGVRPDSITVKLFRNDELIATQEVSANADGQWQYEFNDLAKYDTNGKKYNYTIAEEPIQYYTPTQDGYNLINTVAERPVEPTQDVVNINGQKIWEDDMDAAGKRPATVTFELYRNGKKTGQTAVASATTNWQYQFTALTKYDDQGREYQYTVKEVPVPGYTTSQQGNDFTNTWQKESTSDGNESGPDEEGSDQGSGKQPDKDSSKQPGQKLPQAGEQDNHQLATVIGLMLLVTTIIAFGQIDLQNRKYN